MAVLSYGYFCKIDLLKNGHLNVYFSVKKLWDSIFMCVYKRWQSLFQDKIVWYLYTKVRYGLDMWRLTLYIYSYNNSDGGKSMLRHKSFFLYYFKNAKLFGIDVLLENDQSATLRVIFCRLKILTSFYDHTTSLARLVKKFLG
jgi:hypothetical protein